MVAVVLVTRSKKQLSFFVPGRKAISEGLIDIA
jgi:hypothetical protein